MTEQISVLPDLVNGHQVQEQTDSESAGGKNPIHNANRMPVVDAAMKRTAKQARREKQVVAEQNNRNAAKVELRQRNLQGLSHGFSPTDETP
jgi:hypothetical protein